MAAAQTLEDVLRRYTELFGTSKLPTRTRARYPERGFSIGPPQLPPELMGVGIPPPPYPEPRFSLMDEESIAGMRMEEGLRRRMAREVPPPVPEPPPPPPVSPGARFVPDLQQPLIPSKPTPLPGAFAGFQEEIFGPPPTRRFPPEPGFFDSIGHFLFGLGDPNTYRGMSRRITEPVMETSRAIEGAIPPALQAAERFLRSTSYPQGGPPQAPVPPQAPPPPQPEVPAPVTPITAPPSQVTPAPAKPPARAAERVAAAEAGKAPVLEGLTFGFKAPSSTPDMAPTQEMKAGLSPSLAPTFFEDPGPPQESTEKPAFVPSSTQEWVLAAGNPTITVNMDPRDLLWQQGIQRLRIARGIQGAASTFLQGVEKGSRIQAGLPFGDLNEIPPGPLDEEIARRENLMGYGERDFIKRLTGQDVPVGADRRNFYGIQPLIRERLQAEERARLEARRRTEREEDIRRSEEFRSGEQDERIQARRQERLGAAIDNIYRDDRIKDLAALHLAAQQARQAIASDTSLGYGAVAYQLVRLAGDRGQLARSDIGAFAHRRGVIGIIDRLNVLATGKPTEAYKREVQKLIDVWIEAANDALNAQLEGKAALLSDPEFGAPKGADRTAVLEKLKGYAFEAGRSTMNTPGGGGVTIRNPKTGETQTVAPDTAEKYLKGGWVR